MPSKLSFHINNFDDKILDLLEQMQPSVVKVYEYASDTNIDEIRRRCPKTLIVYRQYTDLDFHNNAGQADQYMKELEDTLNKLGRRGVVWEGINEPVLSNEQDAHTLNKWYLSFAELMHMRGEKVAAFSFSTGNPVNLDLVQLLAPAATACDYLALHEYYNPTSGTADLARYRALRARLPVAAQKPIVITECGLDAGGGAGDGWQGRVSIAEYLSILSNYDEQMLQDPYVVGGTIFQYGGGSPWSSFDVGSIGRRIAEYVVNAGQGVLDSGTIEDSTPIPPLPPEQAAIAAALARRDRWMPINDGGALYKYAQKNSLGYPQTDEYEFLWGTDAYVGQVYSKGIVFAKKGEWTKIGWVNKPPA